jgi:hypothetical protein
MVIESLVILETISFFFFQEVKKSRTRFQPRNDSRFDSTIIIDDDK